MSERFQCLLIITCVKPSLEGYALLPRSLKRKKRLLRAATEIVSQNGFVILKNGENCGPLRASVRKGKTEIMEISVSQKCEEPKGTADEAYWRAVRGEEEVEEDDSDDGQTIKTIFYGHTQDRTILDSISPTLQVDYCSEPLPANRVCLRVDDEDVIEILEDILTHGADINCRDSLDADFMIIASRNEDRNLAHSLLLQGLDVDAKSAFDGATALHRVARAKLDGMTEWLIGRNARIEIVDNYGYDTLCKAAESDAVDVFKLLLRKGAVVDVNWKGKTALNVAVFVGSVGVLEFLLEYIADMIGPERWSEFLHYALAESALRRHPGAVKLLLQNGASVDPTGPDTYGILGTAVSVANQEPKIIEIALQYRPSIDLLCNRIAFSRAVVHVIDFKIIEMLLDYGFSLKPEDEGFDLLFHKAVGHNKLAILERLVDAGANVNVPLNDYGRNDSCRQYFSSFRMYQGDTPLHTATRHSTPVMINYLVSRGASLNALNSHSSAPLNVAVLAQSHGEESGTTEVIETLLMFGADVNLPDGYGRNPLYHACSKRRLDLVQILLRHGAGIDGKDNDGSTALHIASERNCPDVVELLLQYGHNVNAVNNENQTPILLAVFAANLVVVKMLLEFGADVGVADMYGRTVLHPFFLLDDTRAYYCRLRDEKDADIFLQCLLDYDIPMIINLAFKIMVSTLRTNPPNYNLEFVESSRRRLLFHLCKSATLGFIVKENGDSNMSRAVNSLRERITQLSSTDQWKSELTRLKNKRVGNATTTLYDVAMGSRRELACFARNPEFVASSSNVYETEFPLFSSIISSQFKKGMNRRKLLDKAETVVRSRFVEFSHILDVLPKDLILDYLSNQDIIMLDRPRYTVVNETVRS